MIPNTDLLTTAFLTKAVREMIDGVDRHIFRTNILPTETSANQEVVIHINKEFSEATPAVATGASAPVIDVLGTDYVKYSPMEFRRSYNIKGNHLRDITQYLEGFKEAIGTQNTQTINQLLGNANTIFGQWMRQMSNEISNREEKLAVDSLFGQVTFPLSGSGQNFTLDYGFDPSRSFNNAVAWSDTANSTPLQDFQTASSKFRGTGYGRNLRAYMNENTFDKLQASDQVLQYYGGLDAARRVFNNRDGVVPSINNVEIVVYHEGLDENGTFTTFIPDNQVLFIGENNEGGQDIGNLILTPNDYVSGTTQIDGGLLGEGEFVRTQNFPAGNPPYYEMIAGFNGLPAHSFTGGQAVAILTTT